MTRHPRILASLGIWGLMFCGWSQPSYGADLPVPEDLALDQIRLVHPQAQGARQPRPYIATDIETNQPETEASATDQPETNRAETDLVETDLAGAGQVETDQVETARPTTDQIETNQPETERSETDLVATDQPETEASATDQPETNRAETDQVEADSSETSPPETNPPEADSGDTELPAAAVPVGGFWLNPALINGERIVEVRVYLENPTEDAEANGRLEQQILAAFTVQAGDSANPLFLEAGLRRVQQLGEV